MSDVWGAVSEGFRIGGALRQQREQRQRDEAYGQAYQDNGWAGVEQAAGARGDLETANTVQDNANTQQETAIRRATRNAEVLANAATSLMGMPYEQRQARIQQMAPMLTQMGLPEDQIMSFDPTDEALAGIRAVNGQFSQFNEIRSGANGEVLGIRADGSTQVLREGQQQWQTNGTTPYRIGPDGAVQMGSGEIPHRPQGGAVLGLSPEAQNFVAEQYLGGQDIPTGISRGRNVVPIIERATEMANERGMTPGDVGVNRAAYQSARAAWGQMQRARTMISAFETTALENLRIAEEYSARVNRAGVPVVSRWIQAGQRQVSGDPDVAAFHVAVNTFVMEYAKIMSGATGAAGATEGAREEAMSLLSTAHTPEQFQEIVNVMRRDMHNRAVGFEREEQVLRQQMLALEVSGAGGDEEGHGEPTAHAEPQGDPEGPGGGIGAMVGRHGRRGLDALTDEEFEELERAAEERGLR